MQFQGRSYFLKKVISQNTLYGATFAWHSCAVSKRNDLKNNRRDGESKKFGGRQKKSLSNFQVSRILNSPEHIHIRIKIKATSKDFHRLEISPSSGRRQIKKKKESLIHFYFKSVISSEINAPPIHSDCRHEYHIRVWWKTLNRDPLLVWHTHFLGNLDRSKKNLAFILNHFVTYSHPFF